MADLVEDAAGGVGKGEGSNEGERKKRKEAMKTGNVKRENQM